MPIYEYSCGTCRDRQERLLPLSQYADPQVCEVCGGLLHKRISAPMVLGDYPGYECPVTGKWVEGRKQHLENLKRTGCRVQESGEKEQYVERRRREEDKFDAAVEATAEKFVEGLAPEKKEQLVNEVAAGVDVTIERA